MVSNSMSFTAAKDDLSSALSWVARSLPSKPSQPILRGVLITADDDGLTMSGFDYEVSTEVKISADVHQPGKVLVAGKLANDIIGSLPAKPIEVKVEDSSVVVKCGSSTFHLPAMTLDEYPELPQLPATTGSIDPNLFTTAISQVAIAAGKDDSMPMLTGVRMEVDGDEIVLAATDRFRLAVRTLNWDPADSQVKAEILIPAKTLADTARTVDTHLNDPVTVAMGQAAEAGTEGMLGIVADTRKTTTRLLDSDFPKFRPLLPKTHTSIASVEISPLVDAIRRVSLVAERNAQIRMRFDDGQVTLSAGGSDAGTAEETLPANFVGSELEIAFNSNYLKDGLSAITTSRVVFGFTEPSRPAILVPEPEELPQPQADGSIATPETDFTYLLMPVRLPG